MIGDQLNHNNQLNNHNNQINPTQFKEMKEIKWNEIDNSYIITNKNSNEIKSRENRDVRKKLKIPNE